MLVSGKREVRFCIAVCYDENMYGEQVLDLECYWECLGGTGQDQVKST